MENVGFCIRVQALEGYTDRINAFVLVDDYVGVLAVKHRGRNGENPHYHIVVRTRLEPQTFRKRMKKIFPEGKGNEHMSIKPWDGAIDALSYLFHEDPDGPYHTIKGITNEYLAEIRDKNKSVLTAVNKAKEKSSHKLLDIATEHFRTIKTHGGFTDVEIATFMFLHALRNDKYPPQPWLVKSMVTLVQFRLLNNVVSKEEEFASAMAQTIFRTY